MKTILVPIFLLLATAICANANACYSEPFNSPPSPSQQTSASVALPPIGTTVPSGNVSVGLTSTCLDTMFTVYAQVQYYVGCNNTASVYMYTQYRATDDRGTFIYYVESNGYAKPINGSYYQNYWVLRADCVCANSGTFIQNYPPQC